jgi:hypothetical protein
MRDLRRLVSPVLLALVISGSALCLGQAQGESPSAADASAISEALQWLKAPPRFDAEYNFELTVDIRLLLFWTAKDDVGGGYVKVGQAAGDPSLEIIRLLFGSDPARAHGTNRWGAGTEVAKRGPDGTVESSAFFGFMKSSQGDSAGAMQQELADEKQLSQHRFEAIISRVNARNAVSVTVPFFSDHDFDFREVEPAERVVLEQVQQGQARKFHTLAGASATCVRSNGFLSTMQSLANTALTPQSSPVSLCYVYNSTEYTLTLDGARPVPEKTVRFTLADSKQKVEHKYRDLEEARFHTLNHATGKKTPFVLLLGTTGALRGAPVQINYQPNWWFRITLNLETPPDVKSNGR